MLGEDSRDAVPMFIETSSGPSPSVSIVASEVLYRFIEAMTGRSGLV